MDMKKILQAMDGVSSKPVEGANDMKKFVSIIQEGANPHKVALPVQMAMQHYQKPEVKAPVREPAIGKFFKQVEDEQLQEKTDRRNLINQYASVIAERVMMKESKDDYVPPQEADYGPEYQAMVRRVRAQERAKQEKKNEEFNTEGNAPDVVALDVPLLIRLFEYAREDAKADIDLHNVAERMVALSAQGRTLTMNDYDAICTPDQVDEACWKNYKQIGMKKKGTETVPNCVLKTNRKSK